MQREVTLVGIDLAKNIFWIRGEDRNGLAVLDKKVSRERVFETVLKMRPPLVAMEACGGAHYWGRRFEAEGIKVMLIPPQYVTAFRRGDKSDRNDAWAICEASRRPELKPVRVKSIQHQELQMIVRVRESLIQRRTQVLNEARSFLLEYGISYPAGVAKLVCGMRLFCQNETTHETLRQYIERTLVSVSALNEEIKIYDDKIRKRCQNDHFCSALMELSGIGPVTAIAIRATLVNPKDFKNGRQWSAFIGLVPRQHSTGGKTRLLGVAKDGNRYLRQLLVHGGRSVLIRSGTKTDPLSVWAAKKWKERGFNKACVAVANKNARMVWAVMAKTAQKQLAA